MIYILAILTWAAIGLLGCVMFRRQGHNFWIFAGLAVWMGPFIFYVMRLVARQQAPSITRLVRSGTPGDGWLDVLAGIDGSAESTASVTAAVRTILPAVRRIRFVAVLDHETAASPDFFHSDEDLEAALYQTAKTLDLPGAELALLSGRADRSLIAHAADEDFHLLLVSHRNHSNISTLLGSTVQRLSRHSQVPVLVGPPVTGISIFEQTTSASAAIGE
jgi:nucleotide-binding universal stress UspA family protein